MRYFVIGGLVLLALAFGGGLAAGIVTAPPAIGAVTVTGNNNTVIGQVGDGNAATVERARPQRRRSDREFYELMIGVGITLAAFGMIASSIATAVSEDRYR